MLPFYKDTEKQMTPKQYAAMIIEKRLSKGIDSVSDSSLASDIHRMSNRQIEQVRDQYQKFLNRIQIVLMKSL
jgi:hypothetical protein